MHAEDNGREKPPQRVGWTEANARSSVRQPALSRIVHDITSTDQALLARLDKLSFVMDRLYQVPGTRLRLGLNTILLLVPVLGDILPSLLSVLILMVGLNHYRVPRIVAARMVLNTCLDAALGWIPILGDLFDLFFKADTRNVRLLQEYAGQGEGRPRATWQHWVFVIGVLLFFGALCLGIALGVFLLVRWLNQSINHMFGAA